MGNRDEGQGNRLLIPHDGSPLSGAIVKLVEPLLRQGAFVYLLHVEDGKSWNPSALDEADHALTSRGATVVRRTASSRDAAEAILDVAEKERVALIAMSTHGQGGEDRRVRGTVAERVLRAARVPVLMINPASHLRTDLRSVLVPLNIVPDGSAAILEVLLPLARAFGSRVTLLFVDWDDPTDSTERQSHRRSRRREDVEEWLHPHRQRIEAAGLGIEVRIAHGEPVHQILHAAQPGQYDLLAMSTRGRGGIGRLIVGSVAERVLRECRLPVLVARRTSTA